MKVSFFILMLGLIGCTSLGPKVQRLPASQFPFISTDLLQSTIELRSFLEQEKINSSVCEDSLTEAYDFLANLDSDFFRVDYSAEDYQMILTNLWKVRTSLRSHSQSWSSSGELSPECSKAIKDINRAFRYLDDYAGLNYLQLKGHSITGFENEDKSAMFSRSFPWSATTQLSFDSKSDLKTGDVLLWRSTSTVSAAIARIGDVQNSFAHLSVIYVDPKTRKRYNIESLIETGLIVSEFDEAKLHPGVSKLVVYRHKDSDVAERAGKYVFDLAQKTQKHKDRLRYDFNFNLTDHETVFCSEVVHMAFKYGSNGSLVLPTYGTQFNMKNRSFLQAIGADIEEAFQPGDIELEPNFELVAEWRNFHHAKYNHLMDAIFMSMYQWMDDHDYNFKWTFRGRVLGSFVFGLRHTPLVGLFLKDLISDNITRQTISAVISADQVAITIHKDMVKRLNRKSENKIYSFKELLTELEAYRLQDLAHLKRQALENKQGQAYHDPRFHHRFGPKL